MQERENILSGKKKKTSPVTRKVVVSLDRADAIIEGGGLGGAPPPPAQPTKLQIRIGIKTRRIDLGCSMAGPKVRTDWTPPKESAEMISRFGLLYNYFYTD
jgi:hypothetical protein